MPDRITVISLDRTPERWQRFIEVNPHLEIEHFRAVDGRELDRENCIADGLITPANLFRRGALGAAASHASLWRRCVAEGRPLHIAEDDAVLRHDFSDAAAAALAQLPAWDYVLWGWNFDWPMKMQLGHGLGTCVLQANQAELREEWREFQAATQVPLLARLISCTGLCCYSVSPEGARRLLDLVLPVGDAPASYALNSKVEVITTNLDIAISRHSRALQAFVAVPSLALSLNVHSESTIIGA